MQLTPNINRSALKNLIIICININIIKKQQLILKEKSTMVELVKHLARAFVENHEAIKINEIKGSESNIIELRVAKEETGKIIGRKGSLAEAFKTLVSCAGRKENKKYMLQICD
jgi:predicted RNA-binding protein YlqC (UPF0109 family)